MCMLGWRGPCQRVHAGSVSGPLGICMLAQLGPFSHSWEVFRRAPLVRVRLLIAEHLGPGHLSMSLLTPHTLCMTPAQSQRGGKAFCAKACRVA